MWKAPTSGNCSAKSCSRWQDARSISGAILSWTRALGEFGATILFAGNLEGVTQTMPLAIYLGFERSLGVAVALSVMLVGVSVLLLGVTRRLERKDK